MPAGGFMNVINVISNAIKGAATIFVP